MKVQNRQQFLLILTMAVAALFVGERFVFEPLVGLWKARSTKITELRKQVSNGKMLTRRENDVRGLWDHMRTNTLPNNNSLAEQEVLKSFSTWSSDSGATINGITPQWKNDEDDYLTLNCRVEASGDLGSLSRLLYEIENDPMALKMDAVELSSSDNNGQSLKLGLQISGLVLASQPRK